MLFGGHFLTNITRHDAMFQRSPKTYLDQTAKPSDHTYPAVTTDVLSHEYQVEFYETGNKREYKVVNILALGEYYDTHTFDIILYQTIRSISIDTIYIYVIYTYIIYAY